MNRIPVPRPAGRGPIEVRGGTFSNGVIVRLSAALAPRPHFLALADRAQALPCTYARPRGVVCGQSLANRPLFRGLWERPK